MIRLSIQFLLTLLFAISLYFILQIAQKSILPLSMPDLGKKYGQTGQPVANQIISPFQPVPFANLTKSIESPIFFSSRKFGSAVSVLPPVQNTGVPVSNLSLHGIVIEEETPRAMLKQQGQTTQWYVQGQTIGGWKIVKIGENVIDLERGNEKAQISLYREN